MVEGLDLYRLAELLHMDMAEVSRRYTDTVMLAWGTPALVLKVVKPDDACVFLKDNNCSVHPARTRACRMYPMSAVPDETLKDTLIFNVSGEQQHHFNGRWYRARKWIDDNVHTVDQTYVKMECRALLECVPIMNRIPHDREDDVRSQMLRWRFFEFDMDQSFLLQFIDNMEKLKQALEQLTI